MGRLVTPVRQQPPGDQRCIAYAVAAAMEASICRQRQTVVGVPELSVDDLFIEGGSEVGAIDGIQEAVLNGVLEAGCFPRDPPRCPDAAAHLWRSRIRAIGGARKQRGDLIRRELRAAGPLVALIEVFSNFTDFRGAAVYEAVKPSIGFHALCVIGDEVDANGTTGRWIAKNSMGTGWGDGGLVRIAWNDKTINLENVVFVVEDVRQ